MSQELWIVRMETWGCDPMWLAEHPDPTRKATLSDLRSDAKAFRFVDALEAISEMHSRSTEYWGVEMLRLHPKDGAS